MFENFDIIHLINTLKLKKNYDIYLDLNDSKLGAPTTCVSYDYKQNSINKIIKLIKAGNPVDTMDVETVEGNEISNKNLLMYIENNTLLHHLQQIILLKCNKGDEGYEFSENKILEIKSLIYSIIINFDKKTTEIVKAHGGSKLDELNDIKEELELAKNVAKECTDVVIDVTGDDELNNIFEAIDGLLRRIDPKEEEPEMGALKNERFQDALVKINEIKAKEEEAKAKAKGDEPDEADETVGDRQASGVDEDDVQVTVENTHLLTMIKEGKINRDKAKLIEEILPKIKNVLINPEELIEKYGVSDIMLAIRVWKMEKDK